VSEIFHFRSDEQRPLVKRRCFFVCVASIVLAVLGACTSTNAPHYTLPENGVGEKTLAQHFSLSGRISVRVGEKIDSGSIRWMRTMDEERIGLYSPLGSQVAELVSDRRSLITTLRQGKETTTATSVAELTKSLLGVALDLDRMAEWVQGVGLRENESTEVALANGDVWRVTAERFQASGKARFASRVNAVRGDIVVRLLIDEWAPQ
jgi:outer membrane biogenesis lipoprotein LolB